MRTLAWSCAPVVVVCAMPISAFAWNDFGHMAIARLAYAQLSPAAKAKADAILKAHPQYALLSENRPLEVDQNLWVFMRAATWPDMLRDRKNPLNKTEHHGPWHYVNYPINRDGVTGPTPDAAWTPGTDPANVLQALAKCEAELKDAKLDDASKAKALAWYLHLLGDLHQPLHSTAVFSKDYPTGDRGGNDMIVSNAGKVSRLHAIWDDMLGDEPGALVEAWVKQREANATLSREALKGELTKATVAEWTQESVELAKRVVYADGKLQAAKPQSNNTLPTTAPALPVGYMDAARPVAEKRAVLAGARIADTLNAWLAGPVAATPKNANAGASSTPVPASTPAPTKPNGGRE